MGALPWLIGAGILFVATRPAQANTAVTPGGLKRDRPEPATTYGDMKPQTPARKPPYRPEQIDIRPPDETFTRVELPDEGRASGPSRPIPVGTGEPSPGVDPNVPRAFEPRVGPRPTRVRFPDGFERDPIAGVGAVGRRFQTVDVTGDQDEVRDLLVSIVADVTNLQPSDLSYTRDRRGFVFTFQEPPARKPSDKVTLYGKWEVPPIPSVGKLVRLGSNLEHSFFKAYRDEHGTDVLQLVVPG